jgi:hypothetical protein
MTNMFRDAKAFNQPIAKWDVSKAIQADHLTAMFAGASKFNQKLCWNNNHAGIPLEMFDRSGCPATDSGRSCWGNGTYPGTCK